MLSYSGHEREANQFAGHLLIPDPFLHQINDQERPIQVQAFDRWLADYRKAWGVSSEVILLRLLDAHRLDRESYLAYKAWRDKKSDATKDGSGSRAYRHREPRHIFGDGYVKAVLDALSGRHITLTRASRYLDGLKIQDIHQLEAFYAAH